MNTSQVIYDYVWIFPNLDRLYASFLDIDAVSPVNISRSDAPCNAPIHHQC